MNGDLENINIIDDPHIFLPVGGVGLIEQAADSISISVSSGKLSGRQGVRQNIPVLYLHVGQAQGCVHLGKGAETF